MVVIYLILVGYALSKWIDIVDTMNGIGNFIVGVHREQRLILLQSNAQNKNIER